jgi:hypothetical protein
MVNDPEIGKATAVVLKEIGPTLAGFLEKLAGAGCEQIGLLFADKVKAWRFKSGIRVFSQAQQMISDADLKPDQVDLKFLLPFIEKCSLESQPEMIERWAALLANVASSSVTTISVAVFPELLSQLSPAEAHVLEWVEEAPQREVIPDVIAAAFGPGRPSLTGQEFLIVCDNLRRLGLIQMVVEPKPPMNPQAEGFALGSNLFDLKQFIRITHLGRAFLRACRKPKSKATTQTVTATTKH